MSTFKFIHAADIHLDSPLKGLERYEGAPVESIRGAARTAFRNLIDLAIQESVDFVLIAGDLYDGNWKDYSTGLFFGNSMGRLRQAGIPVFMIRGNHDAQSVITRSLSLPDNVHVFSEAAPETKPVEGLGVAIHGQSFATQAVDADLAAAYPEAVPGAFNIGLLHTSLTGREGHDNYAPSTPAVLRGKGYDYWALGHIHAREIVSQDPWVVFPGNIQGRHIGETGAKGCTLVEVEDGRVVEVAHVSLDVVRWESLEIDAEGMDSPDSVIETVLDMVEQLTGAQEGRPLAVRCTIVGSCDAHGELVANPEKWMAELRQQISLRTAGAAWLEKTRFRTRASVDVDTLTAGDSPYGKLVEAIDLLSADPLALRAFFAKEGNDITGHLNTATHGQLNYKNLTDDELKTLLEETRQLLLPRLFAREQSQ